MEKTPLNIIKPLLPKMEAVQPYLEIAYRSRVFTNFGSNFYTAQNRLSEITKGWALPVTNGTVAIEIAVKTMNFQPGAKIAIPDFTHSGTLLAIVAAGLRPILVGVDSKTWQMNPSEVAGLYEGGRIDGAVIVSPFGYRVDVHAWDALNIPLVYDFAGAWGFFPRSIYPICYSLHATKTMGIGEGGFIVFPDEESRIVGLRLSNFDTNPVNRNIESIDGQNGKLDEIRAAFLCAALEDNHLKKIDARIKARRALLNFYLASVPLAYAPAIERWPSMLVVQHPRSKDFIRDAEKHGVQSRGYYPSLSGMPAIEKLVDRASISEASMANCMALPADINLEDAYRVVEALKCYS